MLILVRHGQSEANAAGVLSGRGDAKLTELGRRQAERIGEALAAGRGGAVGQGGAARRGGPAAAEAAPASSPRQVRLLTSPLQRARETADVIAEALGPAVLPPELEDRLIELDYGTLEGCRPSELDPGVWAGWREDVTWRPVGGESFLDLHARLDSLWPSLAGDATGGDVIAVSHVSPIKAGVAWAIGVGPEVAWRLSLGVAAITRISFGAQGPALTSFGETGHLVGL